MKKVYFLRHGESTGNTEHICAGATVDVPLTDLGRNQAEVAGREIHDKQLNIDLILSSPSSRAFDTAAIVANAIGYPKEDIIKSDLLKERYRGDLEGGPSIRHKGMTNEDLVAHGAEAEAEMIERSQKLLSYIQSFDAENVLIVSHNQFGKQLLAYLSGKKFAEMEKLPNAQLIDISDLVHVS